jgi:hypothetical protein
MGAVAVASARRTLTAVLCDSSVPGAAAWCGVSVRCLVLSRGNQVRGDLQRLGWVCYNISEDRRMVELRQKHEVSFDIAEDEQCFLIVVVAWGWRGGVVDEPKPGQRGGLGCIANEIRALSHFILSKMPALHCCHTKKYLELVYSIQQDQQPPHSTTKHY